MTDVAFLFSSQLIIRQMLPYFLYSDDKLKLCLGDAGDQTLLKHKVQRILFVQMSESPTQPFY